MIYLNEIGKTYTNDCMNVEALKGVTLSFPTKGLVAIVGESGSGKSTLLNILGGADCPTEGTYHIHGKDTSTFGKKDWDNFRNVQCGYVFQEYNIFEELTVFENVSIPFMIIDVPESDKLANINRAIECVGLAEYSEKKCKYLSGGQKQRVAIARALAKNPQIILADEPSGNLDSENSEIVFSILKDASETSVVIVVTHDRELAQKYADRIIELSDGKVVYDGNEEALSMEVLVQDEIQTVANGPVELWNSLSKMFHLGVEQCKINIRSVKEHVISNDTEWKNKVYIARKMSYNDIAKIRKGIINKRPLRQWITIVVFTLSLLFLLGAFAFLVYDSAELINDYLEDNELKEIVISKVIESDESDSKIYITQELIFLMMI